MKKSKYIRAVLLVALMVMGIVYKHTMVDAVSASNEEPKNRVCVQQNGENIDSITMETDEKPILHAYTTLEGDLTYSWQILTDRENNQWVTIYDCTSDVITVTYGMLSNYLDDNNLGQIRAVVTSGEDVYISDSVLIEVKTREEITDNKKKTTNSYKLSQKSTEGNTKDDAKSDNDNLVSLTINYLKDTGEQVCDPYIATIYKGMHFKTTVLSPSVAGYEPKFNENDSQLVEEYVFDYDSVSEDITINIYYFPIEVKYEVRYYFQGIYDDDYSMTGAPVIAYGKVGTEPDKSLVEAEFEGFKRINYHPELIAADGSTIFQCFYDREYFLVDLDLDGGHGSDSVYAKYGTAFVVNKPSKAGWTFEGWDADGDNIDDGLPGTVPSRNTSYKAIWDTTDTSYTVVFWYENANDDNYSVVGTKEITGVESNTRVSSADHINTSFEGRDGTHFTYNSSKVESKIVEGDGSTIVNVYFKRNVYELSFTATGVCGLEEHSHDNSCNNLICDITEHNHNQSCGVLACKIEEHTHSNACCSINPENHTHTKNCFDNVGSLNTSSSAIRNAPSNPQDGYIYRRSSYYNRVIYISGSWYVYNGTESSKTIKEPNNSCEGMHVHGSSNCNCKKASHLHDDTCYNYSCGYIAHTHNDDCYKLICTKPVHSHTNNCTNSSKTNTVKVIKAKYQQDIKNDFPITSSSGTEYLGYWWKVPNGAVSLVAGNYIISLDTMPGENLSFSGTSKGTNAKIYYYIEALEGDEGVVTYEGKNFNEHKVVTTVKSGNLTYEEEFHPITGFERWKSNPSFANSSSNPSIQTENFMYYSRKSFKLQFFNKNEFLDDKEATVQYQASLNGLYFEPDKPEGMEENAYYFEGWYTTEGCYEGTKFDFTNGKMPANDMVLYANWAPVTHNVEFYNTYQDMVGGKAPLATVPVKHGEVVESGDVPETNNHGYTAGEWFYIKNGEKVAYRPISIAVKDDLKVYRDWSSSVVVGYTVHYYKIGTTEKVAEDSTGWMFDGSTKTFKAKGGGELNELYDEYKNGWYPTLSSSSIVADSDSDNTIIFYYDSQNPNPYTVKYVDADTGNEIEARKVVNNNEKSVVTEIYKPIDGYISDAYYKQLVLELNKEGDANKNILTFYYTKASNSAYYAVEYYFMNPDGSTYKLNAKIQSPITIGSFANIPEITAEGYQFEKCLVRDGNQESFVEKSKEEMNNIAVNKNGALIRVYYERQKTDYTVHYYISGTETSLKDDKVVRDTYFGTTITEEAGEAVPGYTLVSENQQTKELLLDSSYNVFTFYYEESLKTARYIPVVRDERLSDVDFGFVSQTMDTKKYSDAYDTVSATAKDRFYFAGWYQDEDLTTLVTKDASITPESDTDVTYYALFEPYYTNLTVSKTANGDKQDENQAFVFNVKGTEPINDHIDLEIVLYGSDEFVVEHLPLGNYVVKELTEWSWEYDAESATKTIDAVADATQNKVSFTNTLREHYWLHGDAFRVNVFSD